MAYNRGCRLLLGACFLLTVTALSFAEDNVVGSPVQLEGSVDPEPRGERRYEPRDEFWSSVRRYNLQEITDARHRPSINTHLFPQLAINQDLEWIQPQSHQRPPQSHQEPPEEEHEHPRPQRPQFPEPTFQYPEPIYPNSDHYRPKPPKPEPEYHPRPKPDYHPRPEPEHHPRPEPEHRPKPHRPHPPHRITKTLTKTITTGPTVFWTEFVPFCSLEPLPSSCSVASKDRTITTTDTSRVLRITERTHTYEDAYCLDVVSVISTETSTIDITTTATPVVTITATVGNSVTNTKTVIKPTTVVQTDSTDTTVYESITVSSDCYEYVSTTTVPFPGPTTKITVTKSQSDTDTWTSNDLASCTLAETETIELAPTHTLVVVGYELETAKVYTTVTTDLECSDNLYVVTETLPETETDVIFEATFYTEISTTTGDPLFTCPDTVTVTTTKQAQVTTTSREPLKTFTQTYTDTAFELTPYYWCSGVKSTTTETHTVQETSTRVVTVGVTSTKVVPDSACMVGNALPNHGCPEEFLMAVKAIMIEMTEIFIELRYALYELLPHVHEHDRHVIERFNSLPLQEILGNLPLQEQRDEALWSQKQLKELQLMVLDAKRQGEVPERLFDKINMVLSRMDRIKRALEKRA